MPFQLPDLPYDKNALAPHMSAETLEFHHGKQTKRTDEAANIPPEVAEGSAMSGSSANDAP